MVVYFRPLQCNLDQSICDALQESLSAATWPPKRRVLTAPPPFGYVGKLLEITKQVEASMSFKELAEHQLAKEQFKMKCIVSPPRHGKSLLLGTLFKGQHEILVIEITYNSTSSFDPNVEGVSASSALACLWLRVVLSCLDRHGDGTGVAKHLMFLDLQSAAIQSKLCFDDVVSLFPGLRNTHVVLCIDESSKMTDHFGKPGLNFARDVKQKIMMGLLQFVRGSPVPYRRHVVCTGFTRSLDRFLELSGTRPDCFCIPPVDFTDTIQLGRQICDLYKAKCLDFPVFVWEVVKSTSGLVGWWMEHVKEVPHTSWPINLRGFVGTLSWGADLQNNANEHWKVLRSYLAEESCGNGSEVDFNLANQLIDKSLAVQESNGSFHLSPFALAVVVDAASQDFFNDPVLAHLKELMKACNKWKDGVDGEPFEGFCFHALKARCLLRASDKWTALEVLGLDCRTSAENFSVMGLPNSVVLSEASLKRLLVEPLYYLFPVGTAVFNDDIDTWLNTLNMNAPFVPTANILGDMEDLLSGPSANKIQNFNLVMSKLARSAGFQSPPSVDHNDLTREFHARVGQLARLFTHISKSHTYACKSLLFLVGNSDGKATGKGAGKSAGSDNDSPPANVAHEDSDNLTQADSKVKLLKVIEEAEMAIVRSTSFIITSKVLQQELTQPARTASGDVTSKNPQSKNSAPTFNANVFEDLLKTGLFPTVKNAKAPVDLWLHTESPSTGDESNLLSIAIQLKEDRSQVSNDEWAKLCRGLIEFESLCEACFSQWQSGNESRSKLKWSRINVVAGRFKGFPKCSKWFYIKRFQLFALPNYPSLTTIKVNLYINTSFRSCSCTVCVK